MTKRNVETAIGLWADRHFPMSVVVDQAKALVASGCVDGALLADQLVNFLPRQLWTPANTPMASVIDDCDSHSDVFVTAAYIAAQVPELTLSLSTDSARRGPAELIQTMLTLSNITNGRITFHIGGGEQKQCKPFGHKRAQGIQKMEDLFRIFHAWMDKKGPIDFQGNHFALEKASIGGGMPTRPAIWGLGAGPKLLDYTTTYCDGLAVTCPPVWGQAEGFAKARAQIVEQLKSKGRDPSKFRFGVWFPVLLPADAKQLERGMDSALVRWMSGIFGRIDASLWKDVGLESPVPLDWNYYQHLLPYDTADAFLDEVLSKVTPEHVRQCWLTGSPAEVAKMIQAWIDAGADWVCPMDYLPLALDPSEAPAAFGRSIELCREIKKLNV